MLRWTWMILVLGLAAGAGAKEPEPGRTDGPEGSEYGKGGYQRHHTGGGYYLDGYFGSASVDWEGLRAQSDLIAGFDAGYMVEDWLAFQVGYGYITDQKIGLYSLGMRSSYDAEPFNYYFTLGAEVFSPDQGDSQFGLVPGVGAEMMLNDRLRVGLGYQHDFIFADREVGIDRFTAKVVLGF